METRCVFQHQLPAVPGCAADIAHTVGLRSMELVAKGKEGINNRRGYLMGVIKRGASAHPLAATPHAVRPGYYPPSLPVHSSHRGKLWHSQLFGLGLPQCTWRQTLRWRKTRCYLTVQL
jgi:hypothetical protein